MTTENGALDGGDNANVNEETKTVENGVADSQNVNELEELRKASAGKDSAIGKLQKELDRIKAEKDAEALANKTQEEQLQHFKSQLDSIKADQTLREKLADTGISISDAKKIMEGGSVEERAEALRQVLSEQVDRASKSAVESFKTGEIAKVAKDTPKATNETVDAFTRSMRAGAGI